MGIRNSYTNSLGGDIFSICPKAVFAAIAVSKASCGGDLLTPDYLPSVRDDIMQEWLHLWENGIVSQKPPENLMVKIRREREQSDQ